MAVVTIITHVTKKQALRPPQIELSQTVTVLGEL